MKRLKKITLGLLSLALTLVLLVNIPSTVNAQSSDTTNIALNSGFYCLHPHKKTPTPYDPVPMSPIASTEYTEYSQDTLDQIAGAIILRSQFKEETGNYIDDGTLQSVIWAIVCKRSECIMMEGGNLHLNGRELGKPYYQYVVEHYSELKDDYIMTIWKSSNEEYQDILEARLVEKHGTPSVEKKVQDTNDSGTEASVWQDSADYDIGDTVPFQITATLREMPKFSAYYLEFVDEMQHFRLDENSINVQLINNGESTNVTKYFTISTSYNEETDTTNLNIKCDNILLFGAKDNNQIIVTYDAELKQTANIGSEGNPNKVHLVYTRSSGTADRGITPDDLVIVFTYQLVVNKVDEQNQPLSNASFKLSKLVNGTYQDLQLITDPNNDTIFTWKGIDDGIYRLEETVTPTGYNTMQPIEFKIIAIHDSNAEHPQLHYYNSNYRFDYSYTYEELISDPITAQLDLPFADGYIIPWAADEITTTIVNKAGTTLPATGGMGTKLIYSLGAIMVLASGVLLVSKKRMK